MLFEWRFMFFEWLLVFFEWLGPVAKPCQHWVCGARYTYYSSSAHFAHVRFPSMLPRRWGRASTICALFGLSGLVFERTVKQPNCCVYRMLSGSCRAESLYLREPTMSNFPYRYEAKL